MSISYLPTRVILSLRGSHVNGKILIYVSTIAICYIAQVKNRMCITVRTHVSVKANGVIDCLECLVSDDNLVKSFQSHQV